jgi:hypothetical protein
MRKFMRLIRYASPVVLAVATAGFGLGPNTHVAFASGCPSTVESAASAYGDQVGLNYDNCTNGIQAAVIPGSGTYSNQAIVYHNGGQLAATPWTSTQTATAWYTACTSNGGQTQTWYAKGNFQNSSHGNYSVTTATYSRQCFAIKGQ